MGDSDHQDTQKKQQLIKNIKRQKPTNKTRTRIIMTNQLENNQLTNETKVDRASEKVKKFSKKVTWSNQLISVKVMTPEAINLDKRFKLFPFREEEEDRFLQELNLLWRKNQLEHSTLPSYSCSFSISNISTNNYVFSMINISNISNISNDFMIVLLIIL